MISDKYHHRLYCFQESVLKGEKNASSEQYDQTSLWHSRLGHVNLKSMKILANGGYMPAPPQKKLSVSEDEQKDNG